MSARVALLLAGSGVYDGTELTEGVSCLVHLSRSGADVKMFAPDKPQMHVINHTNGEEMKGEERNVLVESARIARGDVTSLDECRADDFDAIVVPGGFGAAKNLCDYAVKGADMTVDPLVEKTIQDFSAKNKVIGLSCIAPVIAARVLPGVKLTVGGEEEGSEQWPYAGTAGACVAMGATHEAKDYDGVCVDEEMKVVTAPAYMYAGKPHEIDDSLKAMIDTVMKLATEGK
uniref:DJ-1/PfpI domain-containing protein n=2 Tax=Odontella aurita TaxID=265563 RepID=A0A7S4J5Q7_9STRA|mmetsp:Transcript_39293/g.118187  ORF Transcript_39293/g.118187 Transcript_39293/m.118187 type:complete len:231 (+) Transcript_39293:156-848(+)